YVGVVAAQIGIMLEGLEVPVERCRYSPGWRTKCVALCRNDWQRTVRKRWPIDRLRIGGIRSSDHQPKREASRDDKVPLEVKPLAARLAKIGVERVTAGWKVNCRLDVAPVNSIQARREPNAAVREAVLGPDLVAPHAIATKGSRDARIA